MRHGGSIHAPRRAEIRRASAGEKTERVAIGVRAETKTLTRGSACALWHETRDYDVSLSGIERSHYFMTDTKRVRTRNVSRRQRDTPLHDASVFDGSSGLQQDRARDVLVKKLGNRQGNARANGPETPTYLEAYATNVHEREVEDVWASGCVAGEDVVVAVRVGVRRDETDVSILLQASLTVVTRQIRRELC